MKKLNAVVVGAGIGGLYMVHKLREMGLSVQGIEAGSDVGGVWFWNRYPGARCDLMSVDYSYSFAPEIEQEWTWSEQFAAQPEILRYINFVADRLDLRRSFAFGTRVVRAEYDEMRHVWQIVTDKGELLEATYCVMATGPLSIPKEPDFVKDTEFAGEIYYSGRWPKDEVEYEGKRVGVVGVGSTGIQIVPEVAERAKQLFVFQRTPSFSLPMRNAKLSAEYVDELKRNYPQLREWARNSPLGGVRPSTTRPFFSLPREQRMALMEDSWKRGGHAFLGTFSDLLFNEEANDQVADFVRSKIDEVVDDREIANRLKPRDYPIFARRPCLDSGYYETFNEAHVHLVDCFEEPIKKLTARGIRTSKREIELDMVILATGYDGLTGALLAFDVVGRDGRTVNEKWSEGAHSYLGLMMEGFPNLFMICGPNGPSALANIFTINEQNVEWIAAAINHMETGGLTAMEPSAVAETDWMTEVSALAARSLTSKAKTWYVGANIAGKPQGLTIYTGGFHKYRERCQAVVDSGFGNLTFERR